MNNQLRVFRFANRKTQDQLYFETKIPQSKLSKIENGYIKPNQREKELLAKALNCKPTSLFPED